MFEVPNMYQPNLILTNSNIQWRLLSFCFWPGYTACGILVHWPGIEHVPSAVEEVRNPNCRTTRKFFKDIFQLLLLWLFWHNWPVCCSEAVIDHRGLLIAERVGLTIIAILSVRNLTHSTRTGLLNWNGIISSNVTTYVHVC